MPFSLKVLLENLLRTEDGENITADDVRALAGWDADAEPSKEIQFTPARVIMQDFTGVPCVVDLATMREAMAELGGDATRINPLAPAELVIDHSVIADVFGRADAFERNVEIEYQRNRERYQFLRWGQGAFDDFLVVPPGTGIVHQVNLEHLARTVFTRETDDGTTVAYPDTCVGTDSHTTMVNGLGVVGWGVGGIEAEAAMLGQPVSMLIPRVVGFKLSGEMPSGTTATDLVLTITEMLREHGVVGKFVEFYGPGVAAVPLANRATIGNMSPEYGSTIAIFPIDEETTTYLRLTGRTEEQIALVEAYAKEQGLWHDPDREPRYSEYLELDLSTVVPSIAGPKRPQDRVALSEAKEALPARRWPTTSTRRTRRRATTRPVAETFPASDPPSSSQTTCERASRGRSCPPRTPAAAARASRSTVELEDGSAFELDHGAVVIAAITSCTNTSNPSVMIGAALLAKNAVDKGLTSKPWVKTTLAPGSKVVMDYYERAGLTPYLEKLGFNLVGYGCTTCIGNSGPLIPEVSKAVNDDDLSVVVGAERQPQLRGPDQPRREDELPRVAAAGRRVRARRLDGHRPHHRAARPGRRRQGRLPRRHLAERRTRCRRSSAQSIAASQYVSGYADVFAGDDTWRSLPTPDGDTFDWDPESTYVRKPPYFDGMEAEPAAGHRHRGRAGARHARRLGDHRPHLAGGLDQEGLAGRGVPVRARRRAPRTSTPTGRGAATTR